MLDQLVQREPWLERDRVMIDHLRTIGIRKGHPFDPSPDVEAVLDEAAAGAHAWLDARYEEVCTPFADGAHWAVPIDPEYLVSTGNNFAGPDAYTVDARAVPFSYGFFSARHLGGGQFYLMAIVDRDGAPLDGSRTYTLTVPPEAPVTQYWSATVYDRSTHTLLRDAPWSSRSSVTPGLRVEADGAVRLVFSPDRPDDDRNWLPTRADGRFEVLFRLYGPTPPLREKTWVLPDLVAET